MKSDTASAECAASLCQGLGVHPANPTEMSADQPHLPSGLNPSL